MIKVFQAILYMFFLSVCNQATAGQVKILAAEFYSSGKGIWTVDVTLQHEDTGWDHYADDWRLVDESGKVIADRVLLHPHVDEQPFTRGLGSVSLPNDGTIYVEAHDKKHGWSPDKLKVDMSMARDGHLLVKAN